MSRLPSSSLLHFFAATPCKICEYKGLFLAIFVGMFPEDVLFFTFGGILHFMSDRACSPFLDLVLDFLFRFERLTGTKSSSLESSVVVVLFSLDSSVVVLFSFKK